VLLMDTTANLEHFRVEHEAFLAACEAAGPSAGVPACPDWTVADLLYHMYEVQYIWHRVTSERRSGFEGLSLPARPTDEHLASLLRGEHAGYSTMLAAFPADTSIWTWTGQQDFGWLIRRMAQEIAVHRADADQARGVAPVIDAALASDGIDEYLEFFLNASNGAVNGSVHIHCTDVAGEWTIRETADGFAVTREHAKGDCAIRGAASDILLALWRRIPLEACDVVGDPAVAARFVAASSLD
jgi:uncharacterized protein (TIGR03083 family)